jgi:hypothetical protein
VQSEEGKGRIIIPPIKIDDYRPIKKFSPKSQMAFIPPSPVGGVGGGSVLAWLKREQRFSLVGWRTFAVLVCGRGEDIFLSSYVEERAREACRVVTAHGRDNMLKIKEGKVEGKGGWGGNSGKLSAFSYYFA